MESKTQKNQDQNCNFYNLGPDFFGSLSTAVDEEFPFILHKKPEIRC